MTVTDAPSENARPPLRARLLAALRPFGRRALRLGLQLAGGIAAVSLAWVLLYRIADPLFVPAMLGDWWAGERDPAWMMEWRDLSAIPRPLQQAVIAAEDGRFCTHWGFDLFEMGDAIEDALDGGRLRGASTISMQAARMLFLPPSRTPARKLVEAWFTLLIEAAYPKERILALYLNTVHWGPGVYGAAAAARHHFGRDLDRLTPLEAAQLAVLLPNPDKWTPASRGRQQAARRIRTRIGQMAWPAQGVCE